MVCPEAFLHGSTKIGAAMPIGADARLRRV